MNKPIRDSKESPDPFNLPRRLMEEIDGSDIVPDAFMFDNFYPEAAFAPLSGVDEFSRAGRTGNNDQHVRIGSFLRSVFGSLHGLVRKQRFLLAAILALFLLGLISETVEAATNKYPPLFGSRERRYENLKAFTKWTGMLERFKENQPTDGRPCDPPFHRQCDLKKWSALLAGLQGSDRLEAITAVNSYQNTAQYLTDMENWKQEDYWEMPGEFFERNGDCEDYAISKYLSLRRLGFKPSEMRIVVVQDLNLKIGHAILVVYYEGRALILDNQVNEVLDSNRVRHYLIQYSINEEYWWRHRS